MKDVYNMTSKFFNGIISDMKGVSEKDIGIVDQYGKVIACTDETKKDNMLTESLAFFKNKEESGSTKDYTYNLVEGYGGDVNYAVFVAGTDEPSQVICRAITVVINNSRHLYDEKYDKEAFIKKVIFDNILPTDIFIKAREMKFDEEKKRVSYIVKTTEPAPLSEIVREMYPDKQNDFVVVVSENEIAFVKEVKSGFKKDIMAVAQNISKTLSERQLDHIVGVGSPVQTVKDIARSFKEAQVAMDVGRVFNNESTIMNFNSLGIERLIYQLPMTLCEMFLSEIFKKGAIDALDEETLTTIVKFFENNLNLSDTARKLFVHRNTLVYRLEKIKKITGLDIREFDKATTFKVALMVQKYLDSAKNK